MKRILMFLLIMFLATTVYGANEWEQDTPTGSSSPSDLDTNIQNYITEPLERLLFTYRSKAKIIYATAATLTVEAGEVACRDSGSTLIKMRRNTSNTTVSWSDIDTGSEAASTTYYVWAVADADAETFTCKISTSATFPTGVTYAGLLGSFYNDSSSNITNIANTHSEGIGEWYDSGWFAISNSNNYVKTHNLGTTKCLVTIMIATDSSGNNAGNTNYRELNGTEYGQCWYGLTTTTIGFRAHTQVAELWNGSSFSTATYARIIMIALE